jgi:tetratricopeptide (TPR) repeat protein
MRQAAVTAPADISVNSHRGLRGPYSGTCLVLGTLVADAFRRWPDLVAEHLPCLLYAAPDLATLTGPAPPILTFSTPHEERTRFFGVGYSRAVSHAIVTFLSEYIRRRPGTPLTVCYDGVHAADPTEQEFLEIALRRLRPEQLRLVVGTTAGPLPAGLSKALAAYAHRISAAPAAPITADRSDEQLALAYIAADGTSDDPAMLAAYQCSEPAWRTARHDERADALAESGDWNLRLGAIPYHRERGGDPQGKGAAALREALEHCVAMGFNEALYDFGMRGAAVTEARQEEYCQFTAKAATAATALGRPAESESIYLGLREKYALPKVHIFTSYHLAMLYTRWYAPDRLNHNLAKGYCHNAIALAMQEADPEMRAFFTVFQQNGLALVEMHLGHLDEALRLVTEGIQRLDRELPADKYLLHRGVLLHNRARLLVALGRLDDALADFDRVMDDDPNYTEYYIDRGNTARLKGDDTSALADYDRACQLGLPFPEVYYNRGDLRAASGDLTGAISDFAFVLEIDPGHLDARISHVELLIDAEEFAAASAGLADGLIRHPDNAALHALGGLLAMLTDDHARARALLDRAVSLDPGLGAARAHRGMLAATTGDPQLAIADFSAALEILGDDPDLRYQRGLAHLAAGHHDQAAADLRPMAESVDGEHAGEARRHLAELSRRARAVLPA